MSRNPIPLIAIGLFACFFANSQQKNDYRILLKNGSFTPEKNITESLAATHNQRAIAVEGKTFTVIQFEHIPTLQERRQLSQAGIELLDYIPNNAYTVTVKGSLNLAVLNSVKARAIVDLRPEQKMSAMLANKVFPSWAIRIPQTLDVWISFPKTFSWQTVTAMLKEKNIDILDDAYRNYRILALRVSQQRLTELASWPFIDYVQAAPPEDKPLNFKDVVNTRANVLGSTIGRNLDGKGVVLGVGDNGDPLQHIDFAGRLINRAAIVNGAHGVHVTGTAAGAGIVRERFKGQAPKATIVSQVFSGIITNAPSYYADYGMVVTNNSYGNVVDDCESFGIYDLYSRVLDQQALDMPALQTVFAAGNSGLYACSPYLGGFSNVLGGYQTAKNVVTIGATNELGVIAGYSSKGPVRDGRIKPEVVVQGTAVFSTIPVNSYGSNQGTSMAAPGATGGLALLYQRYRQLHGVNPPNALMKAVLCNGAADMGNTGPDFSYGFGWMNLLRSVKMLEYNNYFDDSVANTITNIHTIVVPPNTAQLKVMLYWNDPAAAVLANHALVNDLDLEVADPLSNINLPFLLDTIPGNVNSVAVTGADHINNVEQVVLNSPFAGTYTVSVKGTSVAQNPRQEYFLVYDTIPISTTLTYPIGAEHMTQGDSIYITWESYGNPVNTFTVEYTVDDGLTWTTINAAVGAGVRQLKWFVPSPLFTDKARVRVTRNGTSFISTSEKFTIVGIPVVTAAAVQCEGYFAINWTAIPEATRYQVMMLRGDDMIMIDSVPAAQTNYNFSGLSKDSVYWVTVRAILNGNPGRRAFAISRQPNSGTCSGTISDNDLKVDALIAPVSGRELTSTSLGATTIISARIKNLDDAAINNFNIKYSVNGAPFVSEPNAAVIAAGATYVHNFAVPVNFSAVGNYDVRIVVENTSATDPVSTNDTLRTVVKQLANQPVVVNTGSGFLDNLEAGTGAIYYTAQTGLAGLDRYDFVSNSIYGRLRTFVNSGIAYSGANALTLDADRYNAAGTADSVKGTYNLAAYTTATDDIRLDFQFKQHGQAPNAANNVWVRGDDQKAWIPVYDLYANQDDIGVFKKSPGIELSDLLAANGQNFSSSFQVRWGQWGQILAADNLGGAGYTFDDIHLYSVTNDLQLIRIDTPIVASCGLGNAVPVKITIRNSSNVLLTNIPVKFRVDGGGLVTETVSSIAANSSNTYTFATSIDLSAQGAHTVQAWVDYPTDSYRTNDTVTVHLFNAPVISAFPYLQNFEAGDGSWYADGKKSSWEYGTPASQKINRAASGSKAWKTSLAGSYNDGEQSFLYSPCFDVSAMTHPTLSFSVALDLEDCGTTLCDAAYLEYSEDGNNWSRLGAFNSGTNWYNKNGTGTNKNIWSIQDYTHWHVATIPLPVVNGHPLRLRFVMAADPYTSREGIAIDDIHIYDSLYSIYDGVTMTSPVTQTVSGGTNWIDFVSGGQLVASIQPNSQNLGSTDVQAYINTGPVRINTKQYYHDRNITIKPATVSLADSAIVRFYFLDTETETLINASGCALCTKPSMAYELGVSKYSDGNHNLENGTIADDANGNWLYIASPDVTKVPFGKGYYAEFKVRNFSEFWLNDGGFDKLHTLPVQLMTFTATKKPNNDVYLQWTTAVELKVDRYEIEVAAGADDFQHNRFTGLSSVNSRNSVTEQQYNFTDQEKNKTGVRYYRLKVVNKDGTFSFSEVRPVVFSNAVDWQVYPNPSNGAFNFIYQVNAGEKMVVKIYDVNAKLVREFEPPVTGFVQKLSIDLQPSRYAPGLYLLEAGSGEKKQLFRLVKQ